MLNASRTTKTTTKGPNTLKIHIEIKQEGNRSLCGLLRVSDAYLMPHANGDNLIDEPDACFKCLNTWIKQNDTAPEDKDEPDMVNHPPHYTSHPSGVECIDITRHMGFNLGNALKYIWRADLKHDDNGVEDLKKAIFYLNDELNKRTVNNG